MGHRELQNRLDDRRVPLASRTLPLNRPRGGEVPTILGPLDR
ncbi:hypothetical protein [Actinokineospora terrae]|nr:hypothetical protein [Actinokineospora terrae]